MARKPTKSYRHLIVDTYAELVSKEVSDSHSAGCADRAREISRKNSLPPSLYTKKRAKALERIYREELVPIFTGKEDYRAFPKAWGARNGVHAFIEWALANGYRKGMRLVRPFDPYDEQFKLAPKYVPGGYRELWETPYGAYDSCKDAAYVLGLSEDELRGVISLGPTILVGGHHNILAVSTRMGKMVSIQDPWIGLRSLEFDHYCGFDSVCECEDTLRQIQNDKDDVALARLKEFDPKSAAKIAELIEISREDYQRVKRINERLAPDVEEVNARRVDELLSEAEEGAEHEAIEHRKALSETLRLKNRVEPDADDDTDDPYEPDPDELKDIHL